MAFMEQTKEGKCPAVVKNGPFLPNYEPYSNEADTPALAVLAKRDERYRRSIRILQFFSRLLSFVFSLIISLVLAYTLACYYITKDRSMPPAHTSIWPMPTVVWPTYLLLLFGVITMFIDFIMLAVSCCCLHDSFGGFSSYAMLGAKVVAWLVGMVIFRTMKRADSVWGYACNDELVAEVRTYMNFDKLCTIQSAAWDISIIEVIASVLTLCLYTALARRLSSKTRMSKVPKEDINLEMGSPYKVGVGGPGRYAQLEEPSPYGREVET